MVQTLWDLQVPSDIAMLSATLPQDRGRGGGRRASAPSLQGSLQCGPGSPVCGRGQGSLLLPLLPCCTWGGGGGRSGPLLGPELALQ